MIKRKINYVIAILLFGAILGSLFGNLVGTFLSDGVVKDFFTKSQSFGWGAKPDNWADFNIIRFKTGLFFEVNFVSILGLMVSWYFLRYFR